MRYRNKIGITIIALLMSVVCSYAQDLEIVGMPIDCKESSSSVDYQQYGVLALGNHSYYEWTIEGGADFNPSRTATGSFVTVRFTEGTGTVILRVTERSGNTVLRTGVREISKNIRPTMVSVDGPTGWGAVCLEQKGVVYTATANNAQYLLCESIRTNLVLLLIMAFRLLPVFHSCQQCCGKHSCKCVWASV